MTSIARILFAALLQAPGAQQPAPAQGSAQVQMGFEVLPESVTVGDPFRLTVRIRAPKGS